MDEEKKNQNQEPAQPPAPLSDARKAALLRYMAILFAVAFLLVLLSLILQTHSSKSTISELSAASTSALDNAVKLQEENRALQEEQQLQDQLDELQKKLDEETALNEQLLAASQDEEKDAKQELRDKEQELEHTRMAYEALLTAMNCDTREGNVTFSRAMETVARYVDCLSEEALAEYEKLQEQ